MKWLSLLGRLAVEVVLSAIRVAWLALRPGPPLRPAIIAYPLTVTTDRQITLLANMITLTPGTLSIDISSDKRTLLVHCIDLDSREKLIGAIAAGFETKVLQVLR